MSNIVAVLPVRLASTRLPNKALLDIDGKPMLWHVWQQVVTAGCFGDTIVASDSAKVVEMVESWGGTATLTSSSCLNGTERVASVAAGLNLERVVNVQADMPWIDKQVFTELLHDWASSLADVITPVYRLTTDEELDNPAVVKVARGANGQAIFFSRQSIPFYREWPNEERVRRGPFWGHVGIYGFTRNALRQYVSRSPGPLETAENLEQLRFLEANIGIATSVAKLPPLRVDTPADLVRAREEMFTKVQWRTVKEPDRE